MTGRLDGTGVRLDGGDVRLGGGGVRLGGDGGARPETLQGWYPGRGVRRVHPVTGLVTGPEKSSQVRRFLSLPTLPCEVSFSPVSVRRSFPL